MKFLSLIKGSTFKAGIISFASLSGLAITPAASYGVQIDFSSWQSLGDVLAPAVGQVKLSTDGIQNDDFDLGVRSGAFNYSSQPAADTSSPAWGNFLEVDISSQNINNTTFEGSALKNTVTLTPGDVLRFDWNFRTNESSQNDFAFLVVNNQVIKLASLIDVTPQVGSFLQETGIRSYILNTPGTYTLAIGVVDVGDYAVTSSLEINNASLETVPEPMTIVGSLTALGFGVGMRRRFSKKLTQINNKG